MQESKLEIVLSPWFFLGLQTLLVCVFLQIVFTMLSLQSRAASVSDGGQYLSDRSIAHHCIENSIEPITERLFGQCLD